MNDDTPADTINIWYSPNVKRWNVCALVPEHGYLVRDRHSFESLEEALAFCWGRYRTPDVAEEGCGQ